jgi:hypothetical protein
MKRNYIQTVLRHSYSTVSHYLVPHVSAHMTLIMYYDVRGPKKIILCSVKVENRMRYHYLQKVSCLKKP